jgi:predicted phosphate transport protein (TIGR00153 family)
MWLDAAPRFEGKALPMGLQSVVRWLLPKEDHFYDYLERQATVAHEGATALASFKSSGSAEITREKVQALEHKGDKIVHEMEEALAKTFVTPIDREDLQKLSSELDDIVDLANGAARATVLYGVEKPTEPMVKLMDLLVSTTDVIAKAIPKLRKHQYQDLVVASREIRKLEKEADGIYRQEVSRLFHDPNVEAKDLIRMKQILEDLENAIDHCNLIADTMANLAVKHG